MMTRTSQTKQCPKTYSLHMHKGKVLTRMILSKDWCKVCNFMKLHTLHQFLLKIISKCGISARDDDKPSQPKHCLKTYSLHMHKGKVLTRMILSKNWCKVCNVMKLHTLHQFLLKIISKCGRAASYTTLSDNGSTDDE